jgi:hypothetical protein
MIRATTSRIKNTNGRTFAIQAASPSTPPDPSSAATTKKINVHRNICAYRDVLLAEQLILAR